MPVGLGQVLLWNWSTCGKLVLPDDVELQRQVLEKFRHLTSDNTGSQTSGFLRWLLVLGRFYILLEDNFY